MKAFCTALTALSLGLAAFAASAQQDLEPAVQTSPSASSPPGAPSTAPAAASAAPDPGSGTSRPQGYRAPKPASSADSKPPAPAAAAGSPSKGGKASDRIELETTQISGNRELPKVMYVVPWRKADPGEFTGKPLNSLLDEALSPVDRDVFRRQNRYYAELSGAAGSAKSQPGAAGAAAAAPPAKDEK